MHLGFFNLSLIAKIMSEFKRSTCMECSKFRMKGRLALIFIGNEEVELYKNDSLKEE